MAETIVSPGVFTTETDQSFVAPGQSGTGLAVVGPTEKGFPFVPTDITSFQQYTNVFGAGTSASYVPQTVFSYLQAGSTVKVTRILGNGGWTFSATKKLAAITSGSTIITVFHPSDNTQPTAASLNNSTVTGSYNNFTLVLSGSAVFKQISGSMFPSDPTYIVKQLGSTDSFQTGSAFPYLIFPNFITGSVTTTAPISMSLSVANTTFTSSYAEGYDSGRTPWVLNEAGVRLFRFWHRSAGFKTNKDIKIAILNINPSTTNTAYTTFDIIVRRWNDTDNNPTILEYFRGVTMNPSDANYIGNIIGDKFQSYDTNTGKVLETGDFSNKSTFIRVETAPGMILGNFPTTVYPNGHEAVFEPISGFTGFNLPVANYTASNSGSAIYSGFNYANPDNYNYLNPIPLEATIGNNVPFTKPATDNKFILPFQYGSDGVAFSTLINSGANISTDGTNLFGYDLSSATSGGTLAYTKALNILSNAEQYLFDVLALPGVIAEYHGAVTSYAKSIVETRSDVVYIMDLTGVNDSIATAISVAAGIDSNYIATYYPWVKVRDIGSSKDIFVPPSVIVPQAIAYSDRVGAEWFAAAGIQRGGLGGASDTKIRLSKLDRDALYTGRINPITKFPTTGVLIYGQKTLQVASTLLTRLNIRRALIKMRRDIKAFSLQLVFEQNTTATRNRFLNVVNPYLQGILEKQGLYAYKVIMDDTNNTPDVIARNEMDGTIIIYPTVTAEFIVLNFTIQASGAGISFTVPQ